jgi:hypothetical protein
MTGALLLVALAATPTVSAVDKCVQGQSNCVCVMDAWNTCSDTRKGNESSGCVASTRTGTVEHWTGYGCDPNFAIPLPT